MRTKIMPGFVQYRGVWIPFRQSHGRGGLAVTIRAAIARIKTGAEFDRDDATHRLMWGVVEQAIKDLNSGSRNDQASAVGFFQGAEAGRGWILQSLGLEPEWVADTLRAMELLPNRDPINVH